MNQLILVGFMGAGKSTLGKLVAKELALDFVDLDEALVNKLQMTVAEFFEAYGEEAFRQEESQLLIDFACQPMILATGGGIVLKEVNRDVLKNAPMVIYLAVDPQVSLARIKGDQGTIRPLAVEKNMTELGELMASRQKLYEEVADVTINTSGLTEKEVLAEILRVRQAFT